jgi:non-ribosomal peptide synthetase component F
VPLSYTAWGSAENAYWQPREIETRAAFWKSRLAGSTRLWGPSSAQHSPLQSMKSRIASGLARGSRELARQRGATLFSTLLAVFQAALSRWTCADDIVVGTPVANRNRQAMRETMGYCAGIVPLRGRVDGARPFSDALRSVHMDTVDSFANAMPFVELMRVLGEAPAPGHNPVYQVRFALQNHPMPDVALPNLSVHGRIHSTGTARFDLGCEITEDHDAFEVVWRFRPGQFRQTEIEELERLFQSALAKAAPSPGCPTAALTT